MVKHFIITLYKVMYNRQVKRGLAGDLSTVSSSCTALFIGILIVNGCTIYQIISHKTFRISQGKIENFIWFGVFCYFIHLLIFKFYGLESEKPSENGYHLEEGVSVKIWVAYFSNIVLVLVLPLLRDYYFTHTR